MLWNTAGICAEGIPGTGNSKGTGWVAGKSLCWFRDVGEGEMAGDRSQGWRGGLVLVLLQVTVKNIPSTAAGSHWNAFTKGVNMLWFVFYLKNHSGCLLENGLWQGGGWQKRSRRTRSGVLLLTQGRDDTDLDHGGDHGEKWADLEYILEVETESTCYIFEKLDRIVCHWLKWVELTTWGEKNQGFRCAHAKFEIYTSWITI